MPAAASWLFRCAAVLGLLAVSCFADEKKAPEPINSVQRGQALDMLRQTTDTVRTQYYDPTYHGVDLDAGYKEAEKRIREAPTLSQAFGAIAAMLDRLNDSHTFFLPPPRPYIVEDGWEATFIGENCFLTAVKEGSDAAAKGLKPGDQVLSVDGFRAKRDTWWKLEYAFHGLAPRKGMNLTVVSPGGQPREVTVMSAVKNLPKKYDFTQGSDIWQAIREAENDEKRLKSRNREEGDVFVWKLPAFLLNDDEIDGVLHKANNHKALVIDLRYNGGGSEENLTRLLGGVLDHDVKVADRVERKSAKPLTAKSRGGHAFSGKLVVVVNSRSASASELFARVVQLEKRGTVVGDRSAGAVMEARRYPLSLGVETKVFYGVEVTVADLKMTDGNSLEHHGVVPDELLLPTAADLAAGSDPQLARAMDLAGLSIGAEKAGKLFPTVWR
jgi:C-terminal processing protease CtpA/Prc